MSRGLLGADGALTPAGEALRARVEEETDRLAAAPWQHLGEARTGEVVRIGTALTRTVMKAAPSPGKACSPAETLAVRRDDLLGHRHEVGADDAGTAPERAQHHAGPGHERRLASRAQRAGDVPGVRGHQPDLADEDVVAVRHREVRLRGGLRWATSSADMTASKYPSRPALAS